MGGPMKHPNVDKELEALEHALDDLEAEIRQRVELHD